MLKNQQDNRLSRNSRRPGFGHAPALATLAAMIGIATATLALEDQAAKPQGLTGVLAETVPPSLSREAFDSLGETWAAWSDGAAQAVLDLYQSGTKDIAAQKEALANARAKLKTINTALKDPKYRMIAVPLTGLSQGLSRRLDLQDAILATLEVDAAAEYPKRLEANADAVVKAIDSLTRALDGIPGGKPWAGFVQAPELATALKANTGGDASIAAAKLTKSKLASRAGITDEKQKAFLSRPAFLALESAVDKYLITAENPPLADAIDQMRPHLTAMVAGLEDFEATGLSAGAKQAREAFVALRKVAPDGGERIGAALQKHYFNYNIRIVTSENFLSKLLQDSRTEQGQVSDFILGAAVSGWQTTSTTVGVDVKPSRNDARWDLILTGNIQSTTTGVTSEATVNTQGNHTFRAVKEVRFDGTKFTTQPGTISVNANNTTTGLSTRMSGSLLFGRMADRIAAREVEARRGTAQAIAASRIEERVLPRFNSEVDAAFRKSEKDLQTELYDHWRETGLYPDAMAFQTTDREFRVNSRLMASGELAAGEAPLHFVTNTGATLMVHESEMNNGADRIGLAGKTMTDEEFRTHLEQFFSKVLNREFKIEPPKEEEPAEGEEEGEGKPPGTFVFAASDPIRIRLQSGELILQLRTGFKREGGDDIPQHVISVPLSFVVEGDKIHIVRGTVGVASTEGGGVATSGVIRSKIRKTIPERTVDAKFKLQGTRKMIDARVTDIRIVDGWAVVNIQ